jgi:hypothetical protein
MNAAIWRGSHRAVEVRRKLIEDWKEEDPHQNVTDESIATDIARVVGVDATFPFANRPEYKFDAPNWREQRYPLMNARACDHHDNGIAKPMWCTFWWVPAGFSGYKDQQNPCIFFLKDSTMSKGDVVIIPQK